VPSCKVFHDDDYESTCIFKFLLFWGVRQRRLVVSYRRFGTTHRSNFQGPSSPRTLRLIDPCRWDRHFLKRRYSINDSTLRKIPKQCRSHLHRKGSLISCSLNLYQMETPTRTSVQKCQLTQNQIPENNYSLVPPFILTEVIYFLVLQQLACVVVKLWPVKGHRWADRKHGDAIWCEKGMRRGMKQR